MDSYRQAVSVLPEPLRTRALEVDTPCMARRRFACGEAECPHWCFRRGSVPFRGRDR